MYFDSAEDWHQLGYHPWYSNTDILIESYNNYLQYYNSRITHGFYHHHKIPKSFFLIIVIIILELISRIQNISHRH